MKTISDKRKNYQASKTCLLQKFHLKHKNILKELSASEFLHIWSHYDKDGNGCIEECEIDSFLKELASVSNKMKGETLDFSEHTLREFKNEFLMIYDQDTNGKITVDEMAELLPVDENLLYLFQRNNPLESSTDFMRIWRRFDKNISGYIDAKELESFIKHVLSTKKNVSLNGKKLFEYRYALMKIFDKNQDGKLEFSELAKLIPIKHNFLTSNLFKQIVKVPKADVLAHLNAHCSQLTFKEADLEDYLRDFFIQFHICFNQKELNEMKVLLFAINTVGHCEISSSELRMVLVCLFK